MNKSLLALSVIAALPASVLAVPSYKSNCATQLNHPTLGTGVRFSEDCQIAYVKPPLFGQLEVSGLTVHPDARRFCPEVLVGAEVNEARARLIKIQTKKYNELLATLETPKLQELAKAKSSVEGQVKQLEKQIKDHQKEYDELSIKVLAKHDDLKDCQSDILITDKSTCNQYVDSIKELQQQQRNIRRNELTPLKEQKTRLQYKLRDLNVAIEEEKDKSIELQEAIVELEEMDKAIVKLKEKMTNVYKEASQRPGGDAGLFYYIDWQNLTYEYQRLNPELRVVWEPMPIKKANFYINLRSDDQSINTSPTVISTSVAGTYSQTSVSNPPSLGAMQPLDQPSKALTPATVGFGNSINAQVTLSVPSVCYLVNDDYSEVTDLSDKVSRYLSANAHLTYEVKVRRKYTAKYNLDMIYKRIIKQTSKGGFLSAKNKTKILEDRDSKEMFDIVFDADGSFGWTAEEQDKLTQDLRATLLDRILDQISMFNGMGNKVIAANVPETGAGSLFKLLNDGDCKSKESEASKILTKKTEEGSEGSGNPAEPGSTTTAEPGDTNNNVVENPIDGTFDTSDFNRVCNNTFNDAIKKKEKKDLTGDFALAASSFMSGNYVALATSFITNFQKSSAKTTFIQNNHHMAGEKVSQVSFVDKSTTIGFKPIKK